MKKLQLLLACAAFTAGSFAAQAQIDITIDGLEYAVTTDTSTYNTLAPTGYFNNQPTLETSFGSGAGLYTGTDFNATPNGNYFSHTALAFANAYYNAVLDSDPNALSDGNAMNAENTYFIDYIYPGADPVEFSYQNGTTGFYPTQQADNDDIFASVTLVSVPESSNYSWLGGSFLMVCGLAGSVVRSRSSSKM